MKTLYSFIIISLSFFLFITAKAQLYINEFMASNVTIYADIVDYDDYSDWIEIYNDSDAAIDISGYYLTDDLEDFNKWQIPSGAIIEGKAYLIFWADGYDDYPHEKKSSVFPKQDINNIPISFYNRDILKRKIINRNKKISQKSISFYHTNFKLSKNGEQIGLYNPLGQVIDTISFSHQYQDISYGRENDGSEDWCFYGEPTPQSSNITQGVQTVIYAEEPIFNLQGGFYSGEQSIEITSSFGTEIRFTTDGSRPASTSELYTSTITFDTTTVIRSSVFEFDKIQSKIITQTYFVDEETNNLPVISFTAFPETLFDEEKGIYINEIKDREIPISFEYFSAQHERKLQINLGARLSGDASYIFPNKPFTIYAKGKYGADFIEYPFFTDRKIHKFKSIYLRNSGYYDNIITMFRDAAGHSLAVNNVNIDCQAYQPAVMFLNGQYWGIYNIREKLNSDYFEHHYQVFEEEIDYLKYEWVDEPGILEGDSLEYHRMYDFFLTKDLAVLENFEKAKEFIDINEYTDYQTTEIYYNNLNWINYNIRFWRKRQYFEKWRWVMTDLDYGLGLPSTYFPNINNYNLLSNAIEIDHPSTLFLRKLLENEEYKRMFIQKFAVRLNTVFSSESMYNHIDSLKSNIKNEMPRHINKWKDEEMLYGLTPLQTYEEWEANVDTMLTFAEERTNFQRNHINEYFELNGMSDLTVNITGNGKVFIEDVFISNETFTGSYFNEIPVKIKAVPDVGYEFTAWTGLVNADTTEIMLTPTENGEISVEFCTNNISIVPDTIFTDYTLTQNNSPYSTVKDIVIKPNATLTVEEGVEIRMQTDASIYVYGQLQINGTTDNPAEILPNYNTGADKWGAICFENTTGESVINNLNIIKASKAEDYIKYFANINSYNSDITLDGIDISSGIIQAFYSEYGEIIIKNSQIISEIAGDLINIKYADSALVENCILQGSNAIDADAIDFDNISNCAIRANKIYNFTGENSDGIDLGENATDVLIEDNVIFNCFDKGISIGQASTAFIKNNVIANCGQGVGIKDFNSYAYFDRNTFYGNMYSIACFEKEFENGGSSADVVNCIFSQSTISPYFIDEYSTINISYSVSDTQILEGENNLLCNPQFVNAPVNNFELQATSPCIDAGDPNSPFDPNGTTADIGALYNYTNPPENYIIINEINYNSSDSYDSGDWIEIYNKSDNDINISGWAFFDSNNDNCFTIQYGVIIKAGKYLVLSQDKNLFRSIHSNVDNFIYSFNFGLSNVGELLRLFDDKMNIVDMVEYDDEYPWPVEPGGNGFTLELIEENLNNDLPENWRASRYILGSPGDNNSIAPKADFEYEMSAYCPGTVNFINNSSINRDSILWDFGDGKYSRIENPEHIYTEAGNYNITLHAYNYYGESSYSDSVYFETVVGLPEVSSDSVCNFGQVTLSAQASYGSVFWFDTESGGYYIASGNTFVTDTLYSSTPFYAAQGNFFCQGERVKVIAGITPFKAEFEYYKENSTVSFNNTSLSADSYHWDFDDNTSDIVENPIHIYSASGEYEVVLTANNNYCDESSTYTSTIIIYEDSVMVYENSVKIYPNPVENKLFLEFTNYNSKNIEIQIINSLGQIADIKKFVIDNDRFEYAYDAGGYRAGVYFIKLIFEDRFYIYEIMKF
ncbi:MAG: lamin tail domain-containing protein [Bacteroidales bacterium]|nr:lamin tail domain-containing protein [Bacteroidales bacterium]